MSRATTTAATKADRPAPMVAVLTSICPGTYHSTEEKAPAIPEATISPILIPEA